MPLSDDIEMLAPVLLPNHDPTNANHATRMSWVQAQDAATLAAAQSYTDTETTRAEAAEALLAPLASPTFTGTPQAPTASSGNNSTLLATTAFVQATVGSAIAGIEWKQAVQFASSVDIPNLSDAPVTIGGRNVVDGDRGLLFGQSVASQNGIYVVSVTGTPSGTSVVDGGVADLITTIEPGQGYQDGPADAFSSRVEISVGGVPHALTLALASWHAGPGFTNDVPGVLSYAYSKNGGADTVVAVGEAFAVALGDTIDFTLTSNDGSVGALKFRVHMNNDYNPGSHTVTATYAAATGGIELTRAADMDEAAEFDKMVIVPVQYGSLGGRWYYLSATSATPFVVGTSVATWTQLITGTDLTASQGVEFVGNDIRADLLSTGGLGLDGDSLKIQLPVNSGLQTDATGLFVPPMGIKPAMKETMTAKIGDGVNTTYVINHNLGVENVIALLKRRSDNKVMGIFPYLTDADNLTLVFSDPPTQDQYEIFIEPVSARIA